MKRKYSRADGGLCIFCKTQINDEVTLGKMLSHKMFSVHYFCMLFSSGLEQCGRDEQGLLGFMPKDVLGESRRGCRLKCIYCKKVGATVGCTVGHCRRNFHLPCGIENDSMHQFFDSFRSFCSDHRPRQVISTSDRLSFHGTANTICPICLSSVEARTSNQTLRAPCCKNSWFHRRCLQLQALNSGYFFKCPLCNNKETFQSEMLTYGIYIPEQDASWELEENAYQELLFRHSTCDSVNCKCPMGRNYEKKAGAWKIILCEICGSQGTHIECAHLNRSIQWQCPDCLNTGSKSGVNNNVISNMAMPSSSTERSYHTKNDNDQPRRLNNLPEYQPSSKLTMTDHYEETVKLSNIETDENVDIEGIDECATFDQTFPVSLSQDSSSDLDVFPVFSNDAAYNSSKESSNASLTVSPVEREEKEKVALVSNIVVDQDIEIIGVTSPSSSAKLLNSAVNTKSEVEGEDLNSSGNPSPRLPVIECTYSVNPSYALRTSNPPKQTAVQENPWLHRNAAFCQESRRKRRKQSLMQTTLSPFITRKPVEVIDLTDCNDYRPGLKVNSSINVPCSDGKELHGERSQPSTSRNLFGRPSQHRIEFYVTEGNNLSTVKILVKNSES